MELLSDSEAGELREIRQLYSDDALKGEPEYNIVRFLLRYIGELENEVWSYHHG